MKSEQINELACALAKAQGEMEAASKDSSNPFFKSKYADLNSAWEACRGPLSKNGLSVSQIPMQNENESCLYTILMHSSGQWIQSKMAMNVKADGRTNELQVMGSVISYLRRYALMAIVGISAGDDDDGNSAKNYSAAKDQAKPVLKLVSESHVFEIEDILQDCSPKYIESLHKHLRSQNIIGLQNIPLDLYERIKAAALEQRTKYTESMNELASAEKV